MSPLTRRQLLTGAVGPTRTRPVLSLSSPAPTVRPREEWAVDRPPRGPLLAEEVRFLIVHHSASHNGHTGEEVPAILRSFYDFHTSDRGWNDIAYNYLIDSEGGIWEGRAGSLDGPVAGDATGGNQGFTQLVCVIGDYSTARPTDSSLRALVSVLAWLAERYEISTAPGSEVAFVSRGSNRHPTGTEVRTPTITGHRSMSQTSCPGDNLNPYVIDGLAADVQDLRLEAFASTTTSATTTTTTPRTTTTAATTTSLPMADSTAVPAVTTVPVASSDPGGIPAGMFAAGGALILSVSGLIMWRHRRMGRK